MPAAWISRSARKTCCTSTGASPADGSSTRSSRGRAMSARPIATCCCSPPLIVPARCSSRSPTRGKSATTRASISARPDHDTAVAIAPSSRFSRTLISGKSCRPSATCAMPVRVMSWGSRPVTSRPARWTLPAVALMIPLIVRRSVVLPAAFAPTSATASPSSTWSVMSRSTWTRPYPAERPAMSSSLTRPPPCRDRPGSPWGRARSRHTCPPRASFRSPSPPRDRRGRAPCS